jgi:hypothetical protein
MTKHVADALIFAADEYWCRGSALPGGTDPAGNDLRDDLFDSLKDSIAYAQAAGIPKSG